MDEEDEDGFDPRKDTMKARNIERKKLRKFYEFSLSLFNVFFFLSGIVLFSLGLYIWLYHRLYFELIPALSQYFYILFFLILLGLIILSFTCYAVWIISGSPKGVAFYLIYTLILLVVSMSEFLCGIITYDSRQYLSRHFQTDLKSVFNDKYNDSSAVNTQIIDDIQRKYKCCGSRNFRDWRSSDWYWSRDPSDLRLVPDSCCKTESYGCGVRDHPSNIAYTGCVHGFLKEINDCHGYIGALCMSLSLLQLFGILYSLLLFIHHIKTSQHKRFEDNQEDIQENHPQRKITFNDLL